jgi:hypothetical protein
VNRKSPPEATIVKTIGTLVFALIVSGFSAVRCGAAVYHSDGSAASMQALHDAVLDGDTIMLPAGVFTWSTKVSITKAITILGAGVGSTTIVSNIISAAKNAPFYVVSTGPVRISGLTCFGGPGDTRGFIWMDSAGFRIDHCAFTNLTERGVEAWSTANSWGVVDHCTFDKLSGSPQGVSVFGDGDAAWSRPLSLGTDQAVYIEDCTFSWPTAADSCVDMYDGARVVFRHNQVTNANVGSHGLDSGKYRSPVSWEIYDNSCNVTDTLARQFLFRGGTGVVFDNTVTSTYQSISSKIEVTSYRATGTCIFASYNWGFVSGENPYDGNRDCYGWPALDQIGATPPTDPPDIKSGPPLAGYSVQGSSPAYVWGNIISINGAPPVEMRMGIATYSGECYPTGACGDANVASLIQENRDFFNGTQRPGYTPYVYPHPLATGESTPMPTPTATAIATATVTPTATATFTPTPTATFTPTPTATFTPTPTATATFTPRPTATATATFTPTPTPTPTPEPTATPDPTPTPHGHKKHPKR